MSILESVLDKSVNLLIDIAPKLATLSKNERDSYRKKIEEIYRLFDEVIILMMNRLGTILSIPDANEDEFFKQLHLLNHVQEWRDKEREIRLCGPLRIASREMNSILPKIKAKLSLHSDKEVHEMFQMIEGGEGPFADYISNSLIYLTEFEENQPHSHQIYLEARQMVKNKYKELGEQRKKLVSAELKLYEAI